MSPLISIVVPVYNEERTVTELVEHPSGVRLYPVGRLDYDSMGLMLMTLTFALLALAGNSIFSAYKNKSSGGFGNRGLGNSSFVRVRDSP